MPKKLACSSPFPNAPLAPLLVALACSKAPEVWPESTASRIVFDAPVAETTLGECLAFGLRVTTANGDVSRKKPASSVTLEVSGGLLYADHACQTEAANATTIPEGQTTPQVYFKSTLPGTATLTAKAADPSWLAATHALSVLPDALRVAF